MSMASVVDEGRKVHKTVHVVHLELRRRREVARARPDLTG
jgi:hypothetical protein